MKVRSSIDFDGKGRHGGARKETQRKLLAMAANARWAAIEHAVPHCKRCSVTSALMWIDKARPAIKARIAKGLQPGKRTGVWESIKEGNEEEEEEEIGGLSAVASTAAASGRKSQASSFEYPKCTH